MWKKRSLLVTVDYYCQIFKDDELTTTTSAAVIRKLSSHFARHDIPEVVVSDNGPQFAAEEFAAFAASWDLWHVTSSPGYPQSNGLAEKMVQTAKNILSHAKAEGSDPGLALLEYHSTPVNNLASPAQLLIHSAICCQTSATHDRQSHRSHHQKAARTDNTENVP